MSTYLQGSSDYIPAFQPFQPDLNFYSGILSESQHQYDQGFAKVNSLYNSVLNSPMLRGDNIERRDKYFKTIEQDLKKITRMDLSIDQNVSQAKRIFDPILNDKYIVKDMSYTKGLQNAHQIAEQYRNCVDPDKCKGEFWQEGVDALNYAQEEFQKASPDESLRHQAPSYTPYQNVTKKAIKAAKDSGFNVSYDHSDGRYIVTDTNGQLLLGQDGKGILPQYLYGMFGNDASIQKMYATQAYVQRKNYAKANSNRFGGNEDAAESEYLNTVVQQAIPKIESSQKDLTQLRDRTSTDMKALQVLANTNGGTLPGDGIEDAYSKLVELQTKTDPSEQYHQQVSNLINTTPNVNDLKALRNRVDGIVANANFITTMNTAAYDYAMGTSKRELKTDPYGLASYNNSLDIQKGITLQNHEFGIWQEQEKIKTFNEQAKLAGHLGMSSGNIQDINKYLIDKGITAEKLKKENLPLDVSQWTQADFEKVKEGGLGQDVAGKISEVRNLTGGETTESSYLENSKVLVQAVDNLKNSASNYLKESFDTMKQQFINPIGNNGDEKKAVRDKIWSNMNSILDGTGISPQAILDGTIKTDIFNNQISRFSKSLGRAVTLQEKDIASQVITNQWSSAALAKYQVDKQVSEGLYARRKSDNQATLDKMRADVFSGVDLSIQGTLDPNILDKSLIPTEKQDKMIGSIANSDGLVYKEAARARYINSAQNLYKNDPSRYDGRLGIEIPGKTAVQKANEDFEKNYDKLIAKYDSLTDSWKSASGSSGKGGGIAVKNAMEFEVKGEQRFSPAYMQIEKIAYEVPKATNALYIQANIPTLGDISPDASKESMANKFFEVVRTGDTKGLDFTYKLRNQPKVSVDGQIIPQGAFLDVTMTDETARNIFHLKKDADVAPYKTFGVQVPAGSSPTVDQFIQHTTPTNTDIFMRQEGATLNQNLPNLGSYNITRKGNDLIFTGKFRSINPLTGSEEDIEFEPQNLGESSPEKGIEVGNSILEQAGIFRTNAKKELLTKALQNARSTATR